MASRPLHGSDAIRAKVQAKTGLKRIQEAANRVSISAARHKPRVKRERPGYGWLDMGDIVNPARVMQRERVRQAKLHKAALRERKRRRRIQESIAKKNKKYRPARS